jgi:hypothetical protein
VRSIPAAIALLILVLTISSVLALFKGSSSTQMARGEVRCEGAGAVVVNIEGWTTRRTEWLVASILRFSACGMLPPIPKVTSTALSSRASPFAIGRVLLLWPLTPLQEIEPTVKHPFTSTNGLS